MKHAPQRVSVFIVVLVVIAVAVRAVETRGSLSVFEKTGLPGERAYIGGDRESIGRPSVAAHVP